MTAPVKRRYDASRRREQARQNQRRIIDAAAGLFAARGYAGTSLADIAAAAGVAVPTVTAAFGTKVNVLARAIEVSLAGDDAPVPMADREPVRQAAAEPDPYRAIELYAALTAAISVRAHGVVLAAWAAAPSDPAVAALVARLDAQRLSGMARAARSLAARAAAAGCLAEDVTEDDIRDALWIFNSAQLYGMLLRDRGWTPAQYQAWLARSWTRLLLKPRPVPQPPRSVPQPPRPVPQPLPGWLSPSTTRRAEPREAGGVPRGRQPLAWPGQRWIGFRSAHHRACPASAARLGRGGRGRAGVGRRQRGRDPGHRR